jgi:hypothetical protein
MSLLHSLISLTSPSWGVIATDQMMLLRNSTQASAVSSALRGYRTISFPIGKVPYKFSFVNIISDILTETAYLCGHFHRKNMLL